MARKNGTKAEKKNKAAAERVVLDSFGRLEFSSANPARPMRINNAAEISTIRILVFGSIYVK